MNKSIIIPFINKETRAVILVSSQWSEHVYYTFDHDEVNNKHVRTTPVIALSVCSYHVMYVFQSESTLYSCLNVKEFLARSRREIWSLSDCNWTRTQNHLVHKRTLNHLAKLAKWLSVRLWTKWFWVRVQCQSVNAFIVTLS